MKVHGTHDGKFKQGEVWQYLKECKGATPKMVAAKFGLKLSAVSHMLYRMKAKKTVEATGNTHLRIYTATRKQPKDGRGRHPQTAINLAQGPQVQQVTRARQRGRLHVPEPKHPLDIVMRKL